MNNRASSLSVVQSRWGIPSRQRGAIAVLAAISMLVLVGFAALNLDGGHMILNKSRLQNAVDMAALSAAKTLDESPDTSLASQAIATQAGVATFTATANGQGNAEIGDELAANNISVLTEYSDTLVPFVPGGLNARFVRVTVNALQLQSWFMQVFNNNKQIRATAVSGPSPALTGSACDVSPMLACGCNPSTDAGCTGSFFGYDPGEIIRMKITSDGSADCGGSVGPGNFQLVRLGNGNGGAVVRENLAGGFEDCLFTSDSIDTEPGNSIGPVRQGLNLRFGDASGPLDPTVYESDMVTSEPSPPLDFDTDQSSPNYCKITHNGAAVDTACDVASPPGWCFGGTYSDAYSDASASNWGTDYPGRYQRRILTIPIGDCSTTVNGQGQVPVYGFGCFFLTQRVPNGGNNDADVFGEFIEDCTTFGTFEMNPPGTAGPSPTRIILYKDPNNVDA